MTEKLMEVEWDPERGLWSVAARSHGEADWSMFEGGESELDTLLSLARDVMTGG